MSREHRWKTALHESGHAVCAIALNGRCNGVALYGGENGDASIDELDSTRLAFVAAAGQAAEQLAVQHPAPEFEPESRVLDVDEIESLPIFESSPYLATQLCRSVNNLKGGPSDDRLLAEWAISGNEADPESWARRVEFARYVASGIVEKNAAAIVRVATALFTKTSLSGPEVTAIFQGSKP